jgi:outer membrane receptor protein involved in Fe transport
MKKFLLTCVVSIVGIAGLLAQPPQMQGAGPGPGQGRPGMGSMPTDGKVTGKILDAATSQPVEYASVAIYREKDSTLVNGVVTDATGTFTMENLPYGKFYATVTFIGYKKGKVGGIMLIPNQKTANLGNVKLDPTSTTLNEVVVMGNGNQMEYKIDKKVVNISQNIVASGGTVVDALQNTPSVQTDVEGTLTLRGSSNYTVLIDGKPSVVSGSEALQQIPAGLVQNVEIITNPSAKYDAEGSAGIINVIMKKQKIKGFNGSVSVSAGTNHKDNDNINLNFKYDKWNFSVGADYRNMGFKMNSKGENRYYGDTAYTHQLTTGSGTFSREGYGFRAGVDYSINDKSSISVAGRWGNRSFDRPTSTFYHDEVTYSNTVVPQNNTSLYYKSVNSSPTNDDFWSLNLDYLINFNKQGHQLTASIYTSGSNEDDPSTITQDTTDANWAEISKEKEFRQLVKETGDEKEYRVKVDYTYPITDKSKLEAGVQTDIDNSFAKHSFYADDVQLQYEELTFDDNINAAYATYSNSMKLFDYQLGLRMENENRTVDQLNDKDTTVKRTDFFPTIHLSRKLPWDLQVQASYTRRLSRPRQWSLSPLQRYMDPQTIRYGNPGLIPEFTNSYELNIQKKINEASFASIEGFYRKTENEFQQVTTVIDKVKYITTQNENKSESLGAEGMLNVGLTKWWTLNVSGSVYDYTLYLKGGSTKNTTNWNLTGNTMFRLKTGTSIQLNSMYSAPTVTSQGTRGAFYSTGLAVRQELLKRKASLTLQLRDFIGDPHMESTTQTDNYYSYSESKRETKVITFTFTYRINNYKASNKRSQEDMNMERGEDMGNEQM